MIQNLKEGLGAQGYDVVAFFQERKSKGVEKYKVSYDGATYLFSNNDNKLVFEESPEKFVPQYGGYCSIAMSEGALVNPNPKSFLIQEGKLYLFTRAFFGIIDVKRQWLKDPKGKQILADSEWAKMND